MPSGRSVHARCCWHIIVGALTIVALLWDPEIPRAVPTAWAQTDGVDPLTLLLTGEDAGAAATQVRETQGEDGPSHWARRRWERDRDSKDATSGPLVLENVVYVARDLSAAEQLYRSEVGKLPTFPEATDQLTGTFPFPMTPLGDESAALSGCNDCLAKDEIYVHRRSVVRKGPVVTVVYTYGTDDVITEDLATWFAGQAASHIPDGLLQSVVAGGPAPGVGDQGPPSSADASPASQPDESEIGQDEDQGQVIQTRPKDLAIKLDEAGKNAAKKDEQDGSDDGGAWYQVRYERPRTYAGYRPGPVTVFNQVFVAPDPAAADRIFQEQVKLNERFPEAKEKVGDPFVLKDSTEIGDESRGLSACNASCNSNKEIYLHKRLVARVENVVSVVYIWGLANEEGVTDASARYFASLVAGRIRG
jgi:hypothetical protein